MSLKFRTLGANVLGMHFPQIIQNTGSVINLNNPTGILSNMGFPNATTSYTIGSVIAGGFNKILINAPTVPGVVGARAIMSAAFVANVDMYLCVENNGFETTYFFLQLEPFVNLYQANDAAQNGTGETSTVNATYWSTNGTDISIVSDPDNSGQGGFSLKFVLTSTQYHDAVLTFTGLVINSEYEFSYWHRCENFDGTAPAVSATIADLVGLTYEDPGAPTPGDLYLTPTLDSFTWVKRSFVLRATATTGTLDIYVNDAAQVAEANNKVWIDNVTFKKLN